MGETGGIFASHPSLDGAKMIGDRVKTLLGIHCLSRIGAFGITTEILQFVGVQDISYNGDIDSISGRVIIIL
jgi:hypothetical protein